jgi:hypothetical protein
MRRNGRDAAILRDSFEPAVSTLLGHSASHSERLFLPIPVVRRRHLDEWNASDVHSSRRSTDPAPSRARIIWHATLETGAHCRITSEVEMAPLSLNSLPWRFRALFSAKYQMKRAEVDGATSEWERWERLRGALPCAPRRWLLIAEADRDRVDEVLMRGCSIRTRRCSVAADYGHSTR